MKRTLKTMTYFKNEINTKIRKIQQKFDEAESLCEKWFSISYKVLLQDMQNANEEDKNKSKDR